MPEQMPDRSDEGHPILAGLVALVGVGLAVGLVLGLAVLAGTQVLGLNGAEESADAGSDRSMYLPRPQRTPEPTGPQITLAPTRTPKDEGHDHRKPDKKSTPHQKKISLSASTTSAGQMAPFDLTGVYPGGEGAILQVQRFTDGSWEDFPVTVPVSNETFSTSVQTSQSGVNKFRVVDTDTRLESNEVRVTIG